MKIYTAIEHAKQKLVKEAKEKGIYENFGQKEYRDLMDKYDPMYNQTIDVMEINRQLAALDAFANWCSTYTRH